MTDTEKKAETAKAIFELQVLSELMQELGRGRGSRDEVPTTWLDWLGEQVGRVATRVDLASA
jgi:hypothetical protein